MNIQGDQISKPRCPLPSCLKSNMIHREDYGLCDMFVTFNLTKPPLPNINHEKQLEVVSCSEHYRAMLKKCNLCTISEAKNVCQVRFE